jgi:hypothetical protein
MSVFQGFIVKVSYKEGEGKRGKWRLYSAKMEKEDGTEYDSWISFGFDKPDIKEGDYVKITTEKDAKGYEKATKIEQLKNAPAKGGNTPAQGTSPNVEAPSGTRQVSIEYQSSRKDAIEMLRCLIQMDALPITSAKTKAGEAKRYEELMALVDKLTVRYYNDVKSQRIFDSVADEGAVENEVGQLPDGASAQDETDE